MRKLFFIVCFLCSSVALADMPKQFQPQKVELLIKYGVFCKGKEKPIFSFHAIEYEVYAEKQTVIFKTMYKGEVEWGKFVSGDKTCQLSVKEVTSY